MEPPQSLKFCFVTTFYPPYHFGGDAMFAYQLCQALAERGHRVDVVHSIDAFRLQHPHEPQVSFDHHANVTLHSLETKHPMISALSVQQLGTPAGYRRQLQEILEEKRYDVIHYQNVSLVGGAGVMRLGRGLKLYTTQEYWLICPTHVLFAFNREACTQRRCLRCTLSYRRPPQFWRYTRLIKRCLKHVDTLLVPSRFAIEAHRAAGIDRPMVHLPNFVLLRSQSRRTSEDPYSGKPFFLYVGRLEKLKGVQSLLTIFANYREAGLVIAGDGTYGPILKEQARGLPHVHFLGTLHPDELVSYYRNALAVLVPSLCYETFGLTAAEALTHGTPAVVRRIGALTEIIEQSGGGYTFESLTECLQAMERIRTDPAHRAELGHRGREAAQRLWSTQSHLNRYLQIVDALVEGRSTSANASIDDAIHLPEPVSENKIGKN